MTTLLFLLFCAALGLCMCLLFKLIDARCERDVARIDAQGQRELVEIWKRGCEAQKKITEETLQRWRESNERLSSVSRDKV